MKDAIVEGLASDSEVLPNLTARQAAFVNEYQKDRNGLKAAIRAGYSEKGAGQRGCELLKVRQVRAAIDKANVAAVERASIDQDWVIERLTAVHDASMEKAEDGGFANPAAANKSLELIGKHGGMWQEGHVAGDINIQVNVHPHDKGGG